MRTLFIIFFLLTTKVVEAKLTWHETVFEQGGYAIGQVEPKSEVSFLGLKVPVNDDGRFMIGFGRDLGGKQHIEIKSPSGEKNKVELKIRTRQYKIERVDGLPPRKVNPRSKEEWARIKSDTRQIVAARAKRLERTDYLQAFEWPAHGRISGVYGSQRVLNGDPKRPHFGLDIAAKTGTKVVSPNSGVVTLVHNDMFYSGGTLIIDHGHGVSSTFIHLSEIFVKEGAEVKKGDVIAAIGATGRASGPHLDWRINWMNQRLDPANFVGSMPNLSAK